MIRFAGTVWRASFTGRDPTAPVTSPEGRFHHSGQWAVYTSLNPEGATIAIRPYVRPDDPPRQVHPLVVEAHRVADLRGRAEASVIWQDIRATGAPAPTWARSDTARTSGAQALLYSSRSRPDLKHLVVFAPEILRCDTERAPLASP